MLVAPSRKFEARCRAIRAMGCGLVTTVSMYNMFAAPVLSFVLQFVQPSKQLFIAHSRAKVHISFSNAVVLEAPRPPSSILAHWDLATGSPHSRGWLYMQQLRRGKGKSERGAGVPGRILLATFARLALQDDPLANGCRLRRVLFTVCSALRQSSFQSTEEAQRVPGNLRRNPARGTSRP